MASNIVRKITLKTVCGKTDFDKLMEAPDKRMDLMDVYGIAAKAMPGSTDLGEFLKFKGRFRAINLATGETFESGALILPGVAQDLLGGALSGDEVGDVSFGFRLSVKYDKESVTKYVYEMVSLMKPAEDDPLTRLGQSIGAGQLALTDKSGETAADSVADKSADKPAPKGGKK